jgi:hypothetical protein
MKNIKKTLFLILILFQFSCSHNKLNQFYSKDIKSIKTTKNTTAIQADYMTFSEAISATLLIGPILTSLLKKGVINLNQLDDPANDLKKAVAKAVSQKYNIKLITNNELENTDANWIVDIKSFVNGSYYPFRITKFRTYYSANATIRDVKKDKIVFKSNCSYNKKKDNKFTLKQISENNLLLKKFFENAKDFCKKKFIKDINQSKK